MIEYAIKGTEGYMKAQSGEEDEMDKLANKVEGAISNLQNGGGSSEGGEEQEEEIEVSLSKVTVKSSGLTIDKILDMEM